MKNDIIIFKEGKITDGTMDELLETNFGRKSMKKLIEIRLEKKISSCDKKIETYTIETKYMKVKTFTHVSKKVTIKRAQNLRGLIRWNNSIEATTIKTYLVCEYGVKELYNASIEIKKAKIGEEEEVGEPTNKKKISKREKYYFKREVYQAI